MPVASQNAPAANAAPSRRNPEVNAGTFFSPSRSSALTLITPNVSSAPRPATTATIAPPVSTYRRGETLSSVWRRSHRT